MTPNKAAWWAILQELREPVTVDERFIVYVHTADDNGLDLAVLDPRTEQITHHKITVEDAEVSDGQ